MVGIRPIRLSASPAATFSHSPDASSQSPRLDQSHSRAREPGFSHSCWLHQAPWAETCIAGPRSPPLSSEEPRSPGQGHWAPHSAGPSPQLPLPIRVIFTRGTCRSCPGSWLGLLSNPPHRPSCWGEGEAVLTSCAHPPHRCPPPPASSHCRLHKTSRPAGPTWHHCLLTSVAHTPLTLCKVPQQPPWPCGRL